MGEDGDATPTRAVVGLGNPYRRDDGVGPAIVDRLSERDLPSTDLLDLGDAGFELVHVLAEYEAVVIVDAVDFDGDPGEIVIFAPDGTAELRPDRGTHRTAPFELLELAGRIEDAPATVRLVGVQPDDVSYGEGLGQPIANALSDAANTVVDVTRDL
ncbi:hydrogenase maturation protease [Halorhabdus salina]|uniref:hydrogenase maturation protease n=1 Tax=Halorhabdus salina TaxID=2750670 RepID=UPI0015EF18C6|nr:hydrogenase maturation protease [Halorhabdus salina]